MTQTVWTCPSCEVVMVEMQPRDPFGKFSTMSRTEADVTLRPADGSFLYPPPLRTAEDIFEFWSRVEIPDEALARMTKVYSEVREGLKREMPEKSWQYYARPRWRADNPKPDESDLTALAHRKERESVAQSAHEQWVRENIDDHMPERLERADLRAMFRSAAMVRAGSQAKLSAADMARIGEAGFDTTAGPRPVYELAVHTGLVGVGSRFIDPENYDADGDGIMDSHTDLVKRAIDESLRDQNRKLDKVFDGLHDSVHAVAQTVVASVPETKRRR